MDTISKIVSAMLDYQKEHSITSRCMTNTQYLIDQIRHNCPDIPVKVAPVIVAGGMGDTLQCVVHLVVLINDTDILDPSYETYSLNNKEYYGSYKVFYETLKHLELEKGKEFSKYILNSYLRLSKVADRINKKEFCICNKEYYTSQADYVQSVYKN